MKIPAPYITLIKSITQPYINAKKIEYLLKKYNYLMMQKFLPDININGDKRIIIINGSILNAINRRPQPNEFRANMALNSTISKTELTIKEHVICNDIGKQLVSKQISIKTNNY